jgi:hypothetical protein
LISNAVAMLTILKTAWGFYAFVFQRFEAKDFPAPTAEIEY